MPWSAPPRRRAAAEEAARTDARRAQLKARGGRVLAPRSAAGAQALAAFEAVTRASAAT